MTVTVLDSSGSVVQGAQLELRDLATNQVQKGETQDKGMHTFVNLSLGKYKLTVSKAGFASQVFTDVVVQAAQTTDIKTALKVGTINETIEVSGGTAPLVETTTNAIGTTIDLRQIEDLPIEGRDLTQLSFLVPGASFVQQAGTYDGLPAIAQGNNIDGVISSPSRMKFGGNAAPIVSPRLESIEEMTVDTESLNLDQGYGQANMQLNFVTRRGSNAFHGRVYDDFRNDGLNANSWLNDTQTAITPANPATKNLLHLNDFGASVGGPILKGKLFFFGSYAERKIPGAYTTANDLFTPAAQTGVFSYNGQTVNLFNLAQTYNTSNPGANLPTSVLNCPAVYCPSTVLAAAQAATASGEVSPNAHEDPNLNHLTWQVNNAQTSYFPAARVDFVASQKMRFNLAWNMTKDNYPGANPPDFPGSAFSKTGAGNSDKSYTLSFGFTWTLSPTLVNDFRGGFLYNVSLGAYNAPPLSVNNPQLGWNYPSAPYPEGSQMSGTIFYSGINTEYPVFNASDTMTWQHHAHTMNFGFSWWREQDHYYNPELGYPVVNFGLANGDPAQNAFTIGTGGTLTGASPGQQSEAQQLYAILTGRIASVGGDYAFVPSQHNYVQQIGRYNLDELIGAKGLFFQDSYRIRKSFTLNYGLRWDFTSMDKDLSNLYHSASPAAIYGPSGINNLFNPGVFTTDPNGLNPMLVQNAKPYNAWNKAVQPALGFAWNPSFDSGLLGKLLGGDKTVIRAGFSLRTETEPQQYVWNQATDAASFYYQSFALAANTSKSTGTFTPGTLSISSFNPSANPATAAQFTGIPYALAPLSYQTSEAVSDFTFGPSPGQLGSVNGINPNIQQPYTESWNLGVQRQVGQTLALEMRYVGSRSLRQWFNINPNEVNIFGTTSQFPNSFLTQFKNAQTNLAIYTQANPLCGQPNQVSCSFANNGLPGQVALPIFDAAFATEASGGPGVPLADYGFSNFITELQTGQAGSMAGTLAGINGTVPYLCNLVGTAFSPCATNVTPGTFNAAGAGYPINYFQANPYAQSIGGAPSYTVAEGYSNYNALQVDLRQRGWHGLQFDANYTWSHTLGVASQNNWLGQGAVFTLRDMRLSYGPTLFDLTHVVHVNGTYDLPFGKGKQFANRGGVVDRLAGGWTVGTIYSFQTGAPFLLLGGTNTFNDYGDGGVTLTGVTASQLQSSVGKYPIAGTQNVAFINPKYLSSTGGANQSYIAPNITPGTFGQRVWLHGPHNTYDDVSITKHFPITETLRFSLQAEMLNAFNHPTFGAGATNGGSNFGWNAIQNSAFGVNSNGSLNPYQNSPNGGAREIELRANFEF
ncbi:MAG: carboxypeptidase-like regulatory domain-containing protein [Candidatus Sulfotelmatobacter sp.]